MPLIASSARRTRECWTAGLLGSIAGKKNRPWSEDAPGSHRSSNRHNQGQILAPRGLCAGARRRGGAGAFRRAPRASPLGRRRRARPPLPFPPRRPRARRRASRRRARAPARGRLSVVPCSFVPVVTCTERAHRRGSRGRRRRGRAVSSLHPERSRRRGGPRGGGGLGVCGSFRGSARRRGAGAVAFLRPRLPAGASRRRIDSSPRSEFVVDPFHCRRADPRAGRLRVPRPARGGAAAGAYPCRFPRSAGWRRALPCSG